MIQAIADSLLTEPKDEETWCALYTRSNHEKLVARSCLKLGIRHYLPLVEPDGAAPFHRDRVPLFSSYLFACVTPDLRTELLTTKGIVRLIPVPRPGEMLKELRYVDAALRVWRGILPGPAICRGQRVRVIRGPLAGVEGLVARRRLRRRRERLVLNVTMLGQSAMLEIDARLIQPIGGSSSDGSHARGPDGFPKRDDALVHSHSGVPL
jgi:hypothetical protein